MGRARGTLRALSQRRSESENAMKITKLSVHRADLHYAGAAYSFSQGRSYRVFQTSVVALETDEGLIGYGEICPCGPAYMSGYSEGVVPALRRLAPAVIGEDPLQIARVARRVDAALAGHSFAKTPIDLACWDLAGKASGRPVHHLLGGRLVDQIPIHRVVPLGSPEETVAHIDALRAQGFGHFQVKLGQGVEPDIACIEAIAATRRPGEVIVGDANGAWRRDAALRVSNALAGADIYLEEPCADYAASRAVRAAGHHPVKLDECIETLGDLRRAIAEEALDAIAIKLSRLGGLTRSRMVRDLCADAGVAMTVEDAWGGAIASAAAAHLAASTPPEALLNATDLHNYNANPIATGAPEAGSGVMTVSDRPGLGVAPLEEALGEPRFVWE